MPMDGLGVWCPAVCETDGGSPTSCRGLEKVAIRHANSCRSNEKSLGLCKTNQKNKTGHENVPGTRRLKPLSCLTSGNLTGSAELQNVHKKTEGLN